MKNSHGGTLVALEQPIDVDSLPVSTELDTNALWIADIANVPGQVPGCSAYGISEAEAIANVRFLVKKALANMSMSAARKASLDTK